MPAAAARRERVPAARFAAGFGFFAAARLDFGAAAFELPALAAAFRVAVPDRFAVLRSSVPTAVSLLRGIS